MFIQQASVHVWSHDPALPDAPSIELAIIKVQHMLSSSWFRVPIKFSSEVETPVTRSNLWLYLDCSETG